MRAQQRQHGQAKRAAAGKRGKGGPRGGDARTRRFSLADINASVKLFGASTWVVHGSSVRPGQLPVHPSQVRPRRTSTRCPCALAVAEPPPFAASSFCGTSGTAEYGTSGAYCPGVVVTGAAWGGLLKTSVTAACGFAARPRLGMVLVTETAAAAGAPSIGGGGGGGGGVGPPLGGAGAGAGAADGDGTAASGAVIGGGRFGPLFAAAALAAGTAGSGALGGAALGFPTCRNALALARQWPLG